jgi:serine/threonine-protein kinase
MHPARSVYPTSVRPTPDVPLAMRLVCSETQPEIERLARAVQSVRDLDHRAVLRPLQMVRSNTRLGVITDHVEGLTLAQLLAHGNSAGVAVPPALTLRIIADVVEGLEALRAHASATRRQDWLFGGLTPDNILVSSDGQSRLIDPGLTGAAARQTVYSHEPAALAYTAPELTSPDPHFTAACDVFSIGVMLWELLTGEPLFAAATAAQTLENLHRAPIERVQRHQFVRGEPIAFALAQAVANALKRNPAQRLPDYDALMTALVQAGPIGRPEAVAELVHQCTHKESLAEIKERIALMKQEQEAAATSPRITIPVINKKTQPGLGLPATLPPAEPPASQLSTAPTAPPHASHGRNAAPGSNSAHATARMRKLPSVPQGPISITRVSSAPAPRLADNPEEQVSAFPIGDLRRNSMRRTYSPERRMRWLPMAAAAAALLALGTWSLGLLDGPESGPAPRTAATRHEPPPPAPPPMAAPSEAPAAPVAPSAPVTVEAPTPSAPEPVQEPTPAPQLKQPESAGKDAATPTERRRGRQKPEARQRNGEPKPAKAQRSPNLSPPEPESKPQSDSVIKITPAPAPPAPSPAGIPEDI